MGCAGHGTRCVSGQQHAVAATHSARYTRQLRPDGRRNMTRIFIQETWAARQSVSPTYARLVQGHSSGACRRFRSASLMQQYHVGSSENYHYCCVGNNKAFLSSPVPCSGSLLRLANMLAPLGVRTGMSAPQARLSTPMSGTGAAGAPLGRRAQRLAHNRRTRTSRLDVLCRCDRPRRECVR